MADGAIAAIQTVPHPGDVDANIADHIELARAGASRGASVMLFPELSLTGYELALAPALAFGRADPRLRPLSALAVELGVTLLVGLPLQDDGALRIATAVLTPDGGRAFYLKWFVHASERPPFECPEEPGGANDPALECAGRSARLAICADFNNDAHPARASAAGAEVYLISSFISESDAARDRERLRALSARHRFHLVCANYGGSSGGIESGGGSVWIRPDGAVASEAPSSGGSMVFADPGGSAWS